MTTQKPPQAPAIADVIGNAIDLQHTATLVRAIVTSNDGVQIFIRRPGFTNPDGRSYPKLSGVSVVSDDEVLILDVTGRGGWIVIGKIVRN